MSVSTLSTDEVRTRVMDNGTVNVGLRACVDANETEHVCVPADGCRRMERSRYGSHARDD